MHSNSRPVASNQTGIHSNLLKVVTRNAESDFRRPISNHSRQEFQNLLSRLDSLNPDHATLTPDPSNTRNYSDSKIIFDAGCGNGKSSARIAKQFPDYLVIGIDKSYARLTKTQQMPPPNNVFYLRMDLIDFYRLACNSDLRPHKHYILYPNPWPKAEHLQRRWHGSGIFKNIVSLGGTLELRSNWKIYLNEFARALSVFGQNALVSPLLPIEANTNFGVTYLSDFEEKYFNSGQDLWRLHSEISVLSK